MLSKTHRHTSTREKEIDVLLEIPLRQHAVTAPASGLQSPLETITEDLRNFGLVQISNYLKEVEKEVKHCSKVTKKYKKTRHITHNIYLVLARRFDH